MNAEADPDPEQLLHHARSGEHAQPTGRPPRTGRATGRRARPLATRLPGGHHLEASGRTDLSRGGTPPGPDAGQCGKTLGPWPGSVAALAGSETMNQTQESG